MHGLSLYVYWTKKANKHEEKMDRKKYAGPICVLKEIGKSLVFHKDITCRLAGLSGHHGNKLTGPTLKLLKCGPYGQVLVSSPEYQTENNTNFGNCILIIYFI